MNKEEINISAFLKTTVVDVMRFILKWKILYLIFIILGILLGSGFYGLKKDTYKASLLAVSYSGHYYAVNENIKALGFLLSDPQKFSNALDIHIEDATLIKDISSDTIDDKVVEVKIIYRKNVDLLKLEKGIVEYINKNAYISNDVDLEIIRSKELRNELYNEVKELDSLQNIIIANMRNEDFKNENQKLVINNKEINFFQNDILERKKEIFAIDRMLKKYKGIEIIKSFVPVKVKYYSLSLVIMISTFLSFILGVGLSFIFEIKKNLN